MQHACAGRPDRRDFRDAAEKLSGRPDDPSAPLPTGKRRHRDAGPGAKWQLVLPLGSGGDLGPAVKGRDDLVLRPGGRCMAAGRAFARGPVRNGGLSRNAGCAIFCVHPLGLSPGRARLPAGDGEPRLFDHYAVGGWLARAGVWQLSGCRGGLRLHRRALRRSGAIVGYGGKQPGPVGDVCPAAGLEVVLRWLLPSVPGDVRAPRERRLFPQCDFLFDKKLGSPVGLQPLR